LHPPAGAWTGVDGAGEFEITTFNKLHGNLGSFPAEVEKDAGKLYLYGKPGTREPIWSLLEAFVDKNRTAILAEIESIS